MEGPGPADGTTLRFVEVICSDPHLHRQRLSDRLRDLGDVPEPTWDSLGPRREQLAAWSGLRLIGDSARPLDVIVNEPVAELAGTA